MDAWEEKVREELENLRALWRSFKEREMLPAVREARALGTKEALFAEIEAELEAEARARERGDEFNAVVAAQRVMEALEMLRVYAKGWREKVSGGG
jgi:hypothetical protein